MVKAEQQNREAETAYLAIYAYLPTDLREFTQKQLDESRSTSDITQALYIDEYNRLAEYYLPEQRYIVDDPEYKFMTLAYEVLPPRCGKRLSQLMK